MQHCTLLSLLCHTRGRTVCTHCAVPVHVATTKQAENERQIHQNIKFFKFADFACFIFSGCWLLVAGGGC